MANTQPMAVVVSSDVERGQMLDTRGTAPSRLTWVVTPLAAIIVRAIKAYLQTLVGLMTAAGFGVEIGTVPAGTSGFLELFLAKLAACSTIALVPAGMSVLSNLLILFTQLGDRFPTLKA